MSLADLDVERVRRFCQGRIPAHLRDEIRLEVGVRGNAITIFECRPPWGEWLGPEWSRMRIAQLRWDASDRLWRLYTADRNERWHEYWNLEPSPSIEPLLREIDEDPTAAFWG